jgi:hypothetical protein
MQRQIMKRKWLLLVLLAVGLPAVATEMYSWTDANGVRHFSDSPPPPDVTSAHKVKVAGGVTTNAPVEEAPPKAAESAGPALAAAAGYAPEDIERNCAAARTNKAALEKYRQELDASGNAMDADADKRNKDQLAKATQQIALFCGGH